MSLQYKNVKLVICMKKGSILMPIQTLRKNGMSAYYENLVYRIRLNISKSSRILSNQKCMTESIMKHLKDQCVLKKSDLNVASGNFRRNKNGRFVTITVERFLQSRLEMQGPHHRPASHKAGFLFWQINKAKQMFKIKTDKNSQSCYFTKVSASFKLILRS